MDPPAKMMLAVHNSLVPRSLHKNMQYKYLAPRAEVRGLLGSMGKRFGQGDASRPNPPAPSTRANHASSTVRGWETVRGWGLLFLHFGGVQVLNGPRETPSVVAASVWLIPRLYAKL